MRPFSSAFPASFLTGLVLLYQVSWMEAAPSRPAVRKQDMQTLILPCYLKSSPLSEKKIVFRKTLSSFPFTEKNPRIHQFIREYPSLTFDERISLFVQRTAMGKTPGDVCARLNELAALMDYRKMKPQQRLSCLAAFLEDALLYASSRRYAPLDLEALPLFLNWKWTKDVRPISGNAYWLFGKVRPSPWKREMTGKENWRLFCLRKRCGMGKKTLTSWRVAVFGWPIFTYA